MNDEEKEILRNEHSEIVNLLKELYEYLLQDRIREIDEVYNDQDSFEESKEKILIHKQKIVAELEARRQEEEKSWEGLTNSQREELNNLWGELMELMHNTCPNEEEHDYSCGCNREFKSFPISASFKIPFRRRKKTLIKKINFVKSNIQKNGKREMGLHMPAW